MIRRRLMLRIGVLVIGFVFGAAVAVWVLQDVLADVDHANVDAELLITGTLKVGATIADIEAARLHRSGGEPAANTAIERASKELTEAVVRLGSHPVTRSPEGTAATAYANVRALVPEFTGRALAAPAGVDSVDPQFVTAAVALNSAVQELGTALRTHVAGEQRRASRYFRTIVIALTLAAMLMVNVAVIVLLRTAQMVLRPVGALVEGSRELAAEHFDHRVVIDDTDEFGELACAYNRLAAQLQDNEQRKTETLRQLAVTLNHGLNNAMSIIELQLGLLDRQRGGDPVFAKHLHEIRSCLSRMAGIVASLKHIRRVVLTEYSPGLKMIDLGRSTEDPQADIAAASAAAGSSVPTDMGVRQ